MPLLLTRLPLFKDFRRDRQRVHELRRGPSRSATAVLSLPALSDFSRVVICLQSLLLASLPFLLASTDCTWSES
eukprot:scaffold312115_cov27-Tisochrysis_lutea.AAC.2